MIFAISTLHLLVNALLDLPFEDASSSWFVKTGNLEDVCRIDPIVPTSSHHIVGSNFELVDGDLKSETSLSAKIELPTEIVNLPAKSETERPTLLYVAE